MIKMLHTVLLHRELHQKEHKTLATYHNLVWLTTSSTVFLKQAHC